LDLQAGENPPYVNQVVFAPDRSVGYAATNAGLFKSTDSGFSWNFVDGGLGRRKVVSLATEPSGVVWAARLDGVYRSSDEGQSWGACPH
jgi:hypothetical protein